MKPIGCIHPTVRSAIQVFILIASAAGLTGCATTEPLATKHLQAEVKDPHVSIILLRFKSPPLPQKKLFGIAVTNLWSFAVANESTGWNFRRLDYFSMIFRTREDAMEPDAFGSTTGWVTFLAPPGLNYIAEANPGNREFEMDFFNNPRFEIQVPGDQALIYAGTIERGKDCNTLNPAPCSSGLSIIDETPLARQFIEQYPRGFASAPPLQTRLLTVPLSRTIEIPNRAGDIKPTINTQ